MRRSNIFISREGILYFILKTLLQTLLVQTSILHNALWGDDSTATKPLSQEIENPVDVFNIFNYVTYEKVFKSSDFTLIFSLKIHVHILGMFYFSNVGRFNG